MIEAIFKFFIELFKIVTQFNTPERRKERVNDKVRKLKEKINDIQAEPYSADRARRLERVVHQLSELEKKLEAR